jgi:hypothetical protein
MAVARNLASILAVLQALVAVGALPAGLAMMIEPDGDKIGMPVEILSNTPFNSFFLPGLILFSVNGMLNGYGAFIGFRQSRSGGLFGIGLGVFLILWIGFQVYWMGWIHFLQPVYLGIGIVEVFLGIAIMNSINRSSD